MWWRETPNFHRGREKEIIKLATYPAQPYIVASMYLHNGERKWFVTFVLFAYVRTYIHESPRVVFGEDKAGWIV